MTQRTHDWICARQHVVPTIEWVLCAGNTSAKGHIPYIIFALLDVLRAFPGQVHHDMSTIAFETGFEEGILVQLRLKAEGLACQSWCCVLLVQSLTQLDSLAADTGCGCGSAHCGLPLRQEVFRHRRLQAPLRA